MRLVIHAGCHKTGTTSFQVFCRESDQRLQELGLFYPPAPFRNTTQHSGLMWRIQAEGIEAFRDYLSEVLDAAGPAVQTILLSGEDFENCLIDLHHAQAIEKTARDLGISEVVWVVVTRSQRSYIDSLYAQLSKQGVVLGYDQLVRAAAAFGYFSCCNGDFNYIFLLDARRHLARFRQHTSGSVHVFDMKSFLGGSVLGQPMLELILEHDVVQALSQTGVNNQRRDNQRLSEIGTEYRYFGASLGLDTKHPAMFLLMIAAPIFILVRLLRRRRAVREASIPDQP